MKLPVFETRINEDQTREKLEVFCHARIRYADGMMIKTREIDILQDIVIDAGLDGAQVARALRELADKIDGEIDIATKMLNRVAS